MRRALLYSSIIITTIAVLLFVNQEDMSTDSKVPPFKALVESVEYHEIFTPINAIGTSYSNESIDITALTTEVIDTIHFDDGDFVNEGDVIVSLRQDEETAARNAAIRQLEEHQREYDRLQGLIKNHAASKKELDERATLIDIAKEEIKKIDASIHERTLLAPFSGLLGLRRLSKGALVKPGDIITTLDDITIIKLDFTVSDNFLSDIQKGQKIEALTLSYPDKIFEGFVSSIDTRIDELTRSFTVRAEISNKEHLLRPGMQLYVTIHQDARKALMISEEAIFQRGNAHYVWVVDPGEHIVSQREITIGVRQPGHVEVSEGLSQGELIVVRGIHRLQEGQKIETELMKSPKNKEKRE